MSIFTDAKELNKPLTERDFSTIGLELDEFGYSEKNIYAFSSTAWGKDGVYMYCRHSFERASNGITMADIVSKRYWREMILRYAEHLGCNTYVSQWGTDVFRSAARHITDYFDHQPDDSSELIVWITSTKHGASLRAAYKCKRFEFMISYKMDPSIKQLIKSTLLEAKHI